MGRLNDPWDEWDHQLVLVLLGAVVLGLVLPVLWPSEAMSFFVIGMMAMAGAVALWGEARSLWMARRRGRGE